MNHMEQIAEMLGVELGEEFKIEGYSDNYRYKLTREYLEYFYDDMWYSISGTLVYLLNGQNKVVKIPKSILDEKEREYLSYVIKPFRDSVTYFYKRRYENDELEWIKIEMKNDDVMYFPKFKKGTMYKGMELNKKYSLEDLGI